MRKSVIDEVRNRVLVPYKRAVIILSIISIISILTLVALLVLNKLMQDKQSSNQYYLAKLIEDNSSLIDNISMIFCFIFKYK